MFTIQQIYWLNEHMNENDKIVHARMHISTSSADDKRRSSSQNSSIPLFVNRFIRKCLELTCVWTNNNVHLLQHNTTQQHNNTELSVWVCGLFNTRNNFLFFGNFECV